MTDENEHTPDQDVLAMRALLRERQVPASETSVSPETLQAFYAGELPAEEAQEVALALVADPSLAEDLRVTAALNRAHDEAVVSQPASPSRSRLVWTVVTALAAAVLAFFILRPPPPSPSGSDEVRAGGETHAIASTVPNEGLPRHAFELTWSGGPEGATFDVQVTDSDLDVLFQAFDRAEPKVRVPPEVLADVQVGSELLWRVTAVDADGERSRSPAFTVRVR